jgi:hypothetical protein
MELWQVNIVGGFPLADGTSAKALTGVDDHSRLCVSAKLMTREGHQSSTSGRFGVRPAVPALLLRAFGLAPTEIG